MFNLIPIPPLVGSHILVNPLPYRATMRIYESIGSWGMILMYIIVLRTHLLNAIYTPVLGLFDRMLAVL